MVYTTNGFGTDTAISPVQSAGQSIESSSWLSSDHKCETWGEMEKKASEIMDPKSEFSDSEDDENEEEGPGKSFRRRLSETFGCFAARKD